MIEDELEKLRMQVFKQCKWIHDTEIDSLSVQELRAALEEVKPVRTTPKPVKAKLIKPPIIKPYILGSHYIDSAGKLYQVEAWSNGDTYTIPCGDRVVWNGRTVSASIVLHWLRTGEVVRRVPKLAKPKKVQAVVRIGAKTKHLGYYATSELAEEAKFMFKLLNKC